MSLEVKIIVINEYGKFVGRTSVVSYEDYNNICNIAKSFYTKGGFELTLEDDNYVVFPPEIVQKSILKIEKNEVNV